MLDGNSYATLNVSSAIIDIAVPIRAQNMVLNLYGYNNNQNVSYLFVYAMNSSGSYVLLGGYAVSPGPFQLNVPLSQTYVINGFVQLRLSSYQLAAFATAHITGGINYVIVTIFNIANAPTPAPFQQEINLSITNPVAQLVNPSGSNIIFEYLNGTIIPSWFEGRDSHGDFIWWIKLGQSIPAGSTLLIKMILGPYYTNYYSQLPGLVGEAPQLSPKYGEYDNGQNVFIFYDNFSSYNSSKWNIVEINGNVTVKDGLTLVCPPPANPKSYTLAEFYTKEAFGDNLTVETFGNLSNTITSSGQILAIGLSSPPYEPDNAVAFNSTSPSSSNHITFQANTNASTLNYNSGKYVWRIGLYRNLAYGTQNYTMKSKLVDDYLTSFKAPILYYCYNPAQNSRSSLTLGPFYWVRVRATPPDNLMPRVLFGYLLSTVIGVAYTNSSISNYRFNKIAITAQVSLPLTKYATFYWNSTHYYLTTLQGSAFTFVYSGLPPASSNMSFYLDAYNPGSSSVTIAITSGTQSWSFVLNAGQDERFVVSLPSDLISGQQIIIKVSSSGTITVKEAVVKAIVPNVIITNDGAYPVTIVRIWNQISPPTYQNVSITLLPGQSADLSYYFARGSSIIKVITSNGQEYVFYY